MMDKAIIDVLQSVLKKELDPINSRLGGIEQDVKQLKDGQERLEEDVQGLKSELNDMKQDFKHLKDGQERLEEDVQGLKSELNDMKQDFKHLKDGQERLEEDVQELKQDIKDIKTGQELLQKNIIKSLGEYTEKIANHVDNKTSALNKRVYAVETEIERLIRQ
ncbi:hypothetical protein [Bacillus sp. UNC438CL73TsuS30]|uniref:hypothetical protein n=1 Tax=Bacillus sp. UNC438CL73TsuS30 TaxID=1340434 RepID=UPI000690F646|nr:hypothetical protein [Bacillus sp. UNC438CL73TsuS30]